MTKKVKFILLFSFFIILGLCTKSEARITTSDPTVSSGETATITINSQEPVANGAIDVTSSGGLTFVSVSGGTANGTLVAFAGTENKTNGLVTYTFKVPKVTKTTTYKVTFVSADMADAEGNTVASSSATSTVTVKAKETSPGDDSSDGGDSNKPSDTEDDKPSISFSSINETVYVTSNFVNARETYSTSGTVKYQFNKGDSLTRTGIATSSVNGIIWSRISYKGETLYISSDYLDTKNPIKSEEAKDNPDEKEQDEKDKKNEEEDKDKSNVKALRSLTVEQYKLEPEFAPDITEYAVTVGGDVEKLNIEAMAEDENSTIEILGNSGLLIGENTINIKVTAEDGTVRTYTINVTKVVDVGVQLSELSVENYTLTPEFSSDVYEYTLNIGDTSITSLNINAKSDKENVSIEIAGNTELKPGKNIITILVKSNDDNLTTTYQIVVNIDEAYKQNTQIIAGIDDKDLFMYIGIGAAVLIVLIIIIAVIVKKHRKNEDEDEDFSPLDNYNEDTLNNDKTSMNNSNKSEDSKIHKSIESNNDIVNNDEQEKDKKRKEKLEEFSSYASSSDSDANTTTRKRGKHF